MSSILIEGEPHISLSDYAKAMGISIKTAQQYVWMRKLKSVKVNNRHYVLESLIDPDVARIRHLPTVAAKKIYRRDLITQLYVAIMGGVIAGGLRIDRDQIIDNAITSADALIKAMEEKP